MRMTICFTLGLPCKSTNLGMILKILMQVILDSSWCGFSLPIGSPIQATLFQASTTAPFDLILKVRKQPKPLSLAARALFSCAMTIQGVIALSGLCVTEANVPELTLAIKMCTFPPKKKPCDWSPNH